jgi:hypothetical protein
MSSPFVRRTHGFGMGKADAAAQPQ